LFITGPSSSPSAIESFVNDAVCPAGIENDHAKVGMASARIAPVESFIVKSLDAILIVKEDMKRPWQGGG
jgi:hypothetical protein